MSLPDLSQPVHLSNRSLPTNRREHNPLLKSHSGFPPVQVELDDRNHSQESQLHNGGWACFCFESRPALRERLTRLPKSADPSTYLLPNPFRVHKTAAKRSQALGSKPCLSQATLSHQSSAATKLKYFWLAWPFSFASPCQLLLQFFHNPRCNRPRLFQLLRRKRDCRDNCVPATAEAFANRGQIVRARTRRPGA